MSRTGLQCCDVNICFEFHLAASLVFHELFTHVPATICLFKFPYCVRPDFKVILCFCGSGLYQGFDLWSIQETWLIGFGEAGSAYFVGLTHLTQLYPARSSLPIPAAPGWWSSSLCFLGWRHCEVVFWWHGDLSFGGSVWDLGF